eukprot:COSAG02_NODE_37632_length_439_cov_1.017647_2_plen_60_part_01
MQYHLVAVGVTDFYQSAACETRLSAFSRITRPPIGACGTRDQPGCAVGDRDDTLLMDAWR